MASGSRALKRPGGSFVQESERTNHMTIRIGILGYGNLGRGVESAIRQNPDMELKAVFTRRDPAALKIRTENVPVVSISEV